MTYFDYTIRILKLSCEIYQMNITNINRNKRFKFIYLAFIGNIFYYQKMNDSNSSIKDEGNF